MFLISSDFSNFFIYQQFKYILNYILYHILIFIFLAKSLGAAAFSPLAPN